MNSLGRVYSNPFFQSKMIFSFKMIFSNNSYVKDYCLCFKYSVLLIICLCNINRYILIFTCIQSMSSPLNDLTSINNPFFPFSNQGGYFYQPEDLDMYKIYFEKGPYLQLLTQASYLIPPEKVSYLWLLTEASYLVMRNITACSMHSFQTNSLNMRLLSPWQPSLPQWSSGRHKQTTLHLAIPVTTDKKELCKTGADCSAK